MNLYHIYLVFSPYVEGSALPPIENRVTTGKALVLRRRMIPDLYENTLSVKILRFPLVDWFILEHSFVFTEQGAVFFLHFRDPSLLNRMNLKLKQTCHTNPELQKNSGVFSVLE